MSNENKISVKITPQELTQVIQALQTINDVLKPHLVALTKDERKSLPKMKDKTTPFVKKVHDYAVSNSNFVPAYLNVPELKIDLEAVEVLTQVYRQTEQLSKALDDTILLSGSEAYSASLLYYTSVKAAASSNILNAKPIYEDLKQRFPGRSKTPAVKEI